MARRTKERSRKPVVVIVLEGRNKTEKLYFEHFNKRDNPYRLILLSSESTDVISMAEKANKFYIDNDLDEKGIGDRVFCVLDLDLSEDKYAKLNKIKSKYKDVQFIVSNPCFEVWLMYYFTKYPAIVTSSQKMKQELKKVITKYSENYDVVKEENLGEKHAIAINNAVMHQKLLEQSVKLVHKNPYTEVQDLVGLLMNYRKDN